MNKYRVKSVTYGDGRTIYYVEQKGWFFWRRAQRPFYYSGSSYTLGAKFSTLEEALDYIREKKEFELMWELSQKKVMIVTYPEI